MKYQESVLNKKRRVINIIRILKKKYPDTRTALEHDSALDILIATILSAQCTDKRVNIVTGELFKHYKSASDYANTDSSKLEQMIKSTGFYRAKVKNIIECCKIIASKHNGIVPDKMEELVQLPGVGRKTANVVLGNYFGKAVGIVVDTHVKRLSARLNLSFEDNPDKIEGDLMKVVPKKEWINFGNLLIQHGREICNSRKPKCSICSINKYCPSADI